MNILIVSQYFWPENFRINDLAAGLKEKGHQVYILTGIPNYPDGQYFPGYGFFKNRVQEVNGLRIFRVPLVPRGKGGTLPLIFNYFSFALFASLMGPLFLKGRIDIIFVYEPSPVTVGIPALVLKKIKSAPIMFWVQDLWPESLSATGGIRSRRIIKLVERLVQFIYGRCDRILIQSRAFLEPIEKLGVDSQKLLYFPNSAEDLYRPVFVEHDAPERKIMPGGFRVMFAGNIGAAQDFGTILAAAEQIKNHQDIHWVVIGDGRMRPWLEEEVKKRRLQNIFHLLGRKPLNMMPRYLSLADVLLVTLRRDPIFALTIPSKIQSYLACSKPIIAALDGEGRRIIGEAEAGMDCPAENPKTLAEAVLAMYRLPESERLQMGLRGRKYFERNFERTRLINRLDKWINEVLEEVKACAS